MLGHRFSVITTLSRSVAVIENNLLKYGLGSRCARVRACELPVLSLDDPASDAAAKIGAEIELAKREDKAEVIVLGCAGMAELAARLTACHGVPVIDGVVSAVKLAEALAALGLKTSKIGAYALPRPKPHLGTLASFGARPIFGDPDLR
jgi:allantoin racemase